VGEVMAIGRTFQESLQKALRGLETGIDGLVEQSEHAARTEEELDTLREELRMPGPNRLLYVADTFRAGLKLSEIADLTRIDPWFLAQIEDLVQTEDEVRKLKLEALKPEMLRRLKRKGAKQIQANAKRS
jgi:carbamoyl-phosphate synthase large subunit